MNARDLALAESGLDVFGEGRIARFARPVLFLPLVMFEPGANGFLGHAGGEGGGADRGLGAHAGVPIPCNERWDRL